MTDVTPFLDIQMCGGAPFQIVETCHDIPYIEMDKIYRGIHDTHGQSHPASVMGGGLKHHRRHVGSRKHRTRHGGSLNPVRSLMTGGSLNPIRGLMTGKGRSHKRHVGSRKHRHRSRGYIQF
jgi:hypothetical protein